MTHRAFALLAAFAALAACAADPVLLESDVPLPPGMATVRSADIKRGGGTVTGGTFLLAGEVLDAAAAMSTTIERLRGAGWTVSRSERGLDRSSCTAEKGSRVVEVTIDRRALDPAMSTGSIVVRSVPRG
ncbi:MAG: hypothetical protein ACKOYN_04550 [Planctomycetota bacterium]